MLSCRASRLRRAQRLAPLHPAVCPRSHAARSPNDCPRLAPTTTLCAVCACAPLTRIAARCLNLQVEGAGAAGAVAVVKPTALDRKALKTRLLQTYQSDVPPDNAQVQVQWALVQIVAVSTSAQTMSMQGWWRLYWQDDRLKWNVTDPVNMGIKQIVVRNSDLWLPDEIIYEAISESAQQVDPTVYHDGSVFMSVPKYQTISCPMDLKPFPFDTQYCMFKLGSLSYTHDMVDLVPRSLDPSGGGILSAGATDGFSWYTPDDTGRVINHSAVSLDFPYKPNLEWTLIRVRTTVEKEKYACCAEPFAILKYELEIRRVSLTYMTGIIFPLFVITIVSFLSYFMTAASGGRAGLGIVTILTTTSIYFTASSQMPKVGVWTFIQRMYMYTLINGLLNICIAVIGSSLVLVEADDQLTENYLTEVFRRYDYDQSGHLGPDEVKGAMQEIGLSAQDVLRAFRMLDSDNDGRISKDEWLRLRNIVMFRRTGKSALSKHHNYLTSALIRWGLDRDQRQYEARMWAAQTIHEDLALLTTPKQAKIGWKLLGDLKIAGNWTQLKKTRERLQASKMTHESTLDLEYERRLLERKLDYIARCMLSQSSASTASSFSVSKITPIHQDAADEDAKQMAQYLTYVLNAKGNKLPPPQERVMYAPSEPSLRELLHWTPDELKTFLEQCHGDLATKACFKEYAPKLRKGQVCGATLEQLNLDLLGELGVPVGDRMPLHRGLKLLAKTYNYSCEMKHDVRVSILDAEHLPRMDAWGSCDAYVELRFQDGPSYQEYRSNIVRNKYDPQWSGQHHTFKLQDVNNPGHLTIMVYDNDRVLKDECVGAHILQEVFEEMSGLNPDDVQEHRLSLKAILAEGPCTTQKFKLFKNGKPVVGHDNQQAHVRLGFEFIHVHRGPLSVEILQGEYPRSGVGGRQKIILVWNTSVQSDAVVDHYGSRPTQQDGAAQAHASAQQAWTSQMQMQVSVADRPQYMQNMPGPYPQASSPPYPQPGSPAKWALSPAEQQQQQQQQQQHQHPMQPSSPQQQRQIEQARYAQAQAQEQQMQQQEQHRQQMEQVRQYQMQEQHRLQAEQHRLQEQVRQKQMEQAQAQAQAQQIEQARQKQMEQARAQAQQMEQAQAQAHQMEQARQNQMEQQRQQQRQQQIDAAASPPLLHQSLQQYSPAQQPPAVRSAAHGARDEAVILTSPAKGNKKQLAALRPLGPPAKHNSPTTQPMQTPQPQQQGTTYSPQPTSAGAAAYYSSNGPGVVRFSPAATGRTPGGQGPAWTAGDMDKRLSYEYQNMFMQGGMGGGMAPGGDSSSVQVNGSRMGHGDLRSFLLIVRPCPLCVC